MAKLEDCPTCGNSTSENASSCPNCGEPLASGWAAKIEDERRIKAEEESRLEAEAKAKLIAQKRRKRRVWISIAAVAVIFFVGRSIYSSNLESLDPEEFQARIDALEAEVAKIPASNFDQNVKLYSELRNLDPDNLRYAEKVEFYETKIAEAEANAEFEQRQRERAAELAERKNGFHCLSKWDGSHRAVKTYTEERLRDPDSFEHISTRITPVDENGEHTLLMQYRARNGFGGMTTGVVTATVKNGSCAATITSSN